MRTQPSAQGLPRDIAAFQVSQPNNVDQRALGRVDTDGASRADIERFTAELEGAGGELVQASWRLQRRSAAAARDCDVDRRRNGVDEAMAGERRLQAERGERNALGDLDQVGVRGGCVRPAVDATAKGDDVPGVTQPVQALLTSMASAYVKVSPSRLRRASVVAGSMGGNHTQ